MMRNIWIGAVAALALTGCTTYAEIMDREPFRTDMMHGMAAPIADCVVDRLRRDHQYGGAFMRATIAGAEHVIAAVDAGSSYFIYEWDASFVPIQPATTRVELRTKLSVWGKPQYPDDLWPIIVACAT